MTIGGFMPLDAAAGDTGGGVLAFWEARPDNSWFFANGRSALAHLLRREQVGRLWVPALICPELATAAPEGAARYYGLGPDLSPDTGSLDTLLQPGDCVVGVDYFGRSPSRAFRDYAASRNDVLWVEDRAQALAPGAGPWADWVLYSPRKLFGVPDGGILVRRGGTVEHPDYAGADVTAATAARRVEKDRGSEWHFALYQETERRHSVSPRRMSRLSRALLDATDPAPAIRRRQDNYAVLAQLLSDIALLAEDGCGFAPFGFPVRLPECEAVWRRLCEAGVFPARHFAALPSDPQAFPAEHALGATMMTLPCDQRYRPDDLQRVADAVRDAMR